MGTRRHQLVDKKILYNLILTKNVFLLFIECKMNENAALFFVDRNVNGSLKDKTAFIEYGNSSNSISYHDLYDQSSRLKNLFLKYNISREDRVIILMNDVVQYPVIF